jgi:hypothetical protein
MKKISNILLALFIALMTVVCQAAAETNDEDELLLFVLSGSSGSIEDSTLTLNGVHSVVYFSDRPDRDAGHLAIRDLVDVWSVGSDSFEADPPNAVLSILSEDEPVNAVIILKEISNIGTSVQFNFEYIDGEIPEGDFGPASLFIDGYFCFDITLITC